MTDEPNDSDVLDFETNVSEGLPVEFQSPQIMQEIMERSAAYPPDKPTIVRVRRHGEIIREYRDGERII